MVSISSWADYTLPPYFPLTTICFCSALLRGTAAEWSLFFICAGCSTRPDGADSVRLDYRRLDRRAPRRHTKNRPPAVLSPPGPVPFIWPSSANLPLFVRPLLRALYVNPRPPIASTHPQPLSRPQRIRPPKAQRLLSCRYRVYQTIGPSDPPPGRTCPCRW